MKACSGQASPHRLCGNRTGHHSELAGGRPEDRRVWIEEASGVSRYRLQEREVESRLRGRRKISSVCRTSWLNLKTQESPPFRLGDCKGVSPPCEQEK